MDRVRHLYFDNIRLAMIILVLMVHSAVTYSGIGSWYYREPAALDTVSMVFFAMFQSFTQAFFMGVLFMIAGFFAAGSFGRKGFTSFARERFKRLGIPSLFYMLVINPLILYFLVDLGGYSPKPGFPDFYSYYVASFDFLGGSGPMWFAIALLFFSVFYACAATLAGKGHMTSGSSSINSRRLSLLVILIAACSFLVRLVQPIDTAVLNMQLPFFSQYIFLFIAGILAYKNNWFDRISFKTGRRWLFTGLGAGIAVWLAMMVTGGALEGKIDLYKGGLHWQSAVYAFWESFLAVSVAFGLIPYFREKFNRQNPLIKLLSDNSFAVYCFHAPVIITVSLLLKPVAILPAGKFLLLVLAGVPAAFAFTHFIIRRTPLLKNVF